MVGPDTILRSGASASKLRPGLDHDHSARGGRTSAEILAGTSRWIGLLKPEVIIVHAGVNDLTRGLSPNRAADNVASLIRQARAANPDVAVMVTRPAAPAARVRAETVLLGNSISSMAKRVGTGRSPVVVVDQATGWNLDRFTVEGDTSHPNRKGEEKIAQRYAEEFLALDRCRASQQGDHRGPARTGWLTVKAEGSAVRLRWGRVSDPSGGVRYMIRRDGVALTHTSANTLLVRNSSANATYAVVAVDGRGNVGGVRAHSANAQGVVIEAGGSTCRVASDNGTVTIRWSGQGRGDIWRNGQAIGASTGGLWVEPERQSGTTHYSVALGDGIKRYCGNITQL